MCKCRPLVLRSLSIPVRVCVRTCVRDERTRHTAQLRSTLATTETFMNISFRVALRVQEKRDHVQPKQSQALEI